jgi:hypothetical protein
MEHDMVEYCLNAGREGFLIRSSGVVQPWSLRDNVTFNEDDIIFPEKNDNHLVHKLTANQKARAKGLQVHNYFTVFGKVSHQTNEVYLFATQLTEMDSEND